MRRRTIQVTMLAVIAALAGCAAQEVTQSGAVTGEVKVNAVTEEAAAGKTVETMPEGCVRHRFTVPSPSMKREIQAAVVLPPEYAKKPDATYPVIYALHGARAPYLTYSEMSHLRKFLVDHPMILVCFNGDPVGCYVDSTQKADSQFATFFFDELLPHIEKNYRTNGQRAVTGFSMGGYGAMNYLLTKPEAFVSAGAQSGAFRMFSPPKPGGQARHGELLGPYKGNEAAYAKCDIYGRLEKRIADGKTLPPIQLRCGVEDFLLQENRDLVNFLAKQNAIIKKDRIDPMLKAITDNREKRARFGALRKEMMLDFEYTESPGAHNWPYWLAQSRAVAEFHWRHFQAAKAK